MIYTSYRRTATSRPTGPAPEWAAPINRKPIRNALREIAAVMARDRRMSVGALGKGQPLGPNGRRRCRWCGVEVPDGYRNDLADVDNVVGLPRTAPPLGECVAGGRAWWKKNALWECDHILPVAEGGGFCTIDNLRTLCVECHKAKTAELHARLAANRKARARRIAAPRSE